MSGDKEGAVKGDMLAQATVDSYLAALASIANFIGLTFPDIGTPHERKLIRLRNRLAFEADPRGMVESREALQNELLAFGEKARSLYNSRGEAVQRAISVLAGTEHGLSEEGSAAFQKLRMLAKTAELRAAVEAAAEERDQILATLAAQMRTLEGRMKTAEMTASIDPLTGVGNRREFDHHVAARLAAGKDFCLLLFDIDNFQEINERHGHLCGDELLKQVAARLNNQVRTRDFVCRWGGDEFLVLMECDITNATRRARQIAHWLSGPYRVSPEGSEMRVEMQISVAMAAHQPGDSAQEVIARADQLRHPAGEAVVCETA